MKYKYIVFGSELETDLEFMQLVKSDNKSSRDKIFIIERKEIPHYIQSVDKKCGYFFGSELSFLENKSLVMWVEDGKKIYFVRKEGANENYIRTYLLGYGLSMLFLQQRKLMMHCSVVRKDDKAIILCGESGCGKSTITGKFLEKGFEFMADDTALIDVKDDKTIVYPAFPYQKLCRDAALDAGRDLEKLIYIDEDKDKFLVPYTGKFTVLPAAVSAMIILDWDSDNEICCEELKSLHKIVAVGENLFLRNLLRENKYKPQTGSLCLKYGAAVPIYYLRRNKQKNMPQDVAEFIEKIVY